MIENLDEKLAEIEALPIEEQIPELTKLIERLEEQLR